MDEGLLSAWADNLEELSDPALALAFAHLEKTREPKQGMPAPGEITALASRLRGEELDRLESTARRDEYAALEKRRQEHPEEFISFAEVVAKIRDKFQTTGDQRTSPLADEKAWAERKAEVQRQKVQLLGNKAQ